MSGLNSYEGNSVIAAHQQMERLEAIRESDEVYSLPECPACGERTMEQEYRCIAANGPVTAYCYTTGKRGCIWKLTGRCEGAKKVKICNRCGEIGE